ncbi:formate--tetrahydrofolate ligase [Candidatus Margulisiibacteriota bacterium]
MLTDIEIAQRAKLRSIEEIAKKAGFLSSEIELYGKDKAKINLSALKRLRKKKDGKLILVTTITPTPWGEGKTTTTIGLAQALKKIGKKSFICIREPSLGPVMGMKGGAAGGGYSQVLPMDAINLHFTGDVHVTTSAHNLLAAIIDNHVYQGNNLRIDPKNIAWKRVMDMNDRALRNISVEYGLGKRKIRRNSGFDITAASEAMAVMCLSNNLTDMKQRLGRIIAGYTYSGRPVTAKNLKVNGAMALLMGEAIKPSIVQSIEGAPAFIHGGPFANIAHGCNSLIATRMALKASDYVVTEAGFGADLGMEKFFNIKCRAGKLKPDAVVLTVTIRALKRQGGVSKEKLSKKNMLAVKLGVLNLAKHIENIRKFNIPLVISINKRKEDSKEEISYVIKWCRTRNALAILCDFHGKGGAGGAALAKEVVKLSKNKNKLKFTYDTSDALESKIEKIARSIYGANGVNYSKQALKDIKKIKKVGCGRLPICMAKTHLSLSDNSKLLGRPKGFKLNVRGLKVSAGAGFIVVYTGSIVTMPGLPKHPAAENMDIAESGKIKGLF